MILKEIKFPMFNFKEIYFFVSISLIKNKTKKLTAILRPAPIIPTFGIKKKFKVKLSIPPMTEEVKVPNVLKEAA